MKHLFITVACIVCIGNVATAMEQRKQPEKCTEWPMTKICKRELKKFKVAENGHIELKEPIIRGHAIVCHKTKLFKTILSLQNNQEFLKNPPQYFIKFAQENRLTEKQLKAIWKELSQLYYTYVRNPSTPRLIPTDTLTIIGTAVKTTRQYFTESHQTQKPPFFNEILELSNNKDFLKNPARYFDNFAQKKQLGSAELERIKQAIKSTKATPQLPMEDLIILSDAVDTAIYAKRPENAGLSRVETLFLEIMTMRHQMKLMSNPAEHFVAFVKENNMTVDEVTTLARAIMDNYEAVKQNITPLERECHEHLIKTIGEALDPLQHELEEQHIKKAVQETKSANAQRLLALCNQAWEYAKAATNANNLAALINGYIKQQNITALELQEILQVLEKMSTYELSKEVMSELVALKQAVNDELEKQAIALSLQQQ